jgi:hypothetical protein
MASCKRCLHFCKISIERLFPAAFRRPPQNVAVLIGRFYLPIKKGNSIKYARSG